MRDETREQLEAQLRDARELLDYYRRDVAALRDEARAYRLELDRKRQEFEASLVSLNDDRDRMFDAAVVHLGELYGRERELYSLVIDLRTELLLHVPSERTDGLIARTRCLPDPAPVPLTDGQREAIERGDGVEDRSNKHHCWCYYVREYAGRPVFIDGAENARWEPGPAAPDCGQCGNTGWCY